MNAPHACRLAGMAYLLASFCSPAMAQEENPFERDGTRAAQLTCRYMTDEGNMGVRQHKKIIAKDFTFYGKEARSGFGYGALQNLFITRYEPEEMRDACERAAVGTSAGFLVDYGATGNYWGQHEIWHAGEIASRRGEPVERIVVFGDSLSDTNNALNESLGNAPNQDSWFMGRCSNGPVWTEYLATATGLSLNTWANGGAKGMRSTNLLVNGFDNQVDSFIAYMKDIDYDPSRTLFAVWIGANDVMNNERTDVQVVRDIMTVQWKSLKRLSDFGAKKIVMLNLPDVSKTPSFRDSGPKGVLAHDAVRTYNDWLPEFAKRFEQETGTAIHVIDIASVFNQVIDDPESWGFGNASDSCLALKRGSSPVKNYVLVQQKRASCDQDTNVFWDLVHPTTAVHQMISDYVLDHLPKEWGLGEP